MVYYNYVTLHCVNGEPHWSCPYLRIFEVVFKAGVTESICKRLLAIFTEIAVKKGL